VIALESLLLEIGKKADSTRGIKMLSDFLNDDDDILSAYGVTATPKNVSKHLTFLSMTCLEYSIQGQVGFLNYWVLTQYIYIIFRHRHRATAHRTTRRRQV